MLTLAPAVLLQVTPANVTRMLRADVLELSLGLLLVALGVLALTVYARPHPGKESSLPWFGLFALLYGLRLLARTDTFPLLFGSPPAFWNYLASAITYVVPLPIILFLRASFPRWRRSLSGLALLLAAFAAGAIVADAVLQRPKSAQAPNNLIAIAFLAGSLALLFRPGWRPDRDARTLRVGLVSASVMAVADNLRGLGALSWRGPDVEPVGFTVLIACLGTIAARRAFEGAQRLVAIEKELSIARQIQASILPGSMPRVAGLSVAARYQPMTAVAGDFYEFLEVGERRLGVLVADVSGHGVPAALIASMVKVAIAAQTARADRPAAVLAGMNETLSGRLGGQYVTAAYLFLDREAGVMRYSAAGHPPLLRWRPDRPTDELEENGLPLGLMDVADYGQLEQPLREGDRFLLYTDGLVEATNAAGEFLGAERVKAAVAASGGLSTERVADLILEQTQSWAHAAAADDLTVVLVASDPRRTVGRGTGTLPATSRAVLGSESVGGAQPGRRMSLRFGNFVFDEDTRQLLEGGETVALSPKAFELLRYLVRERPRAVSKDELHARIWPDTNVTEASLASAASDLRAALHDRGPHPQFIRTVHGFGYAFCGDARPIAKSGALTPPPLSGDVVCRLIYKRREIDLTEGENILGRDRDAVVWLDSPTVSRRHARITVSGEQAMLEDLGSRNGTWIRGRRITGPVPLSDFDEVKLGSVVTVFRVLESGSTESA